MCSLWCQEGLHAKEIDRCVSEIGRVLVTGLFAGKFIFHLDLAKVMEYGTRGAIL